MPGWVVILERVAPCMLNMRRVAGRRRACGQVRLGVNCVASRVGTLLQVRDVRGRPCICMGRRESAKPACVFGRPTRLRLSEKQLCLQARCHV